jgi:parvulin-like peptidyl-prolyl isomerase
MKKLWLQLIPLLVFTVVSAVAQMTPDEDGTRQFYSLPDAPLVYIDDTVLTIENFGDYLFNAGVHPSGHRDRDLDTLRARVDALLDEVVVIMDLDSTEILEDIHSRRRMRRRVAQRAGPVVYRELIKPHVSVSREEIETLYNDSLLTLFTAPAQRELRHILIQPQPKRGPDGKRIRRQEDHDAARQTAESLKVEIEAGQSMSELASEYSADSASRKDGGYLGWVFPGNTVHDFDTAAFAAGLNEVRGPIRSPYGYHLIRVEGIRAESTIVLSDTLALMIESRLAYFKGQKAGEIWADSIINATDWTYRDALLNQMPDVHDSEWVVTINDRDTLWYDDWKGAWEYYKKTRKIEGTGTLEDKHHSLRNSGYIFLYMQAAEDNGFDDDSTIVAEGLQHLRSEAVRMSRVRLRELQTPPAHLIDPTVGLHDDPMPEKPVKLQYVRAADTATIWTAYRKLTAGESMKSVARRYHDDLREARAGDWNLGWVGQDDLAAPLWGSAWILEPGRFTRPVEYDSAYYILYMVDRHRPQLPQERRNMEIAAVREEYKNRGLAQWRKEIRKGHRIRLDRSYWKRVQQLWRK